MSNSPVFIDRARIVANRLSRFFVSARSALKLSYCRKRFYLQFAKLDTMNVEQVARVARMLMQEVLTAVVLQFVITRHS